MSQLRPLYESKLMYFTIECNQHAKKTNKKKPPVPGSEFDVDSRYPLVKRKRNVVESYVTVNS